MRFLSFVRLATASEVEALRAQLETERAMNTKLAIAIDQQRTAIADQALQLADARDEIDAGENRHSRLQAELDRVHLKYQELVLRHDEANLLIQRLQSERPQMRLVRNEKPLAGESDGESAPSTDEVIVPEHKVVMAARVIGIFFEGKTHWSLSANDHTFKVPVHDKDFLAGVHAGEQLFGHGSVIRAEFLETTYRRPADGEPYTERTLEHVIEVIPPPSTTNTQLELAGTPKGATA